MSCVSRFKSLRLVIAAAALAFVCVLMPAQNQGSSQNKNSQKPQTGSTPNPNTYSHPTKPSHPQTTPPPAATGTAPPNIRSTRSSAKPNSQPAMNVQGGNAQQGNGKGGNGKGGNGQQGNGRGGAGGRGYAPRSNIQYATVQPSKGPPTHGHPNETNTGRAPHGSGDGPVIAAGAAAAGAAITAIIIHHEHGSTGYLGKNGPEVPKDLDMNGFSIKGLVRPNWPVVLDFAIDSPGAARVDIITADNRHHFRATIHNTPNRRAYGIFHLPANFGENLQTAIYKVQAVPLAGSSAPPPQLRTFGLGAGDRAVGSVAIDQLTFQPAAIHPKQNEVASFGFHAHSNFNGVTAEFVFTTLNNGHVLVEKDQEQKMDPVEEDQHDNGTWAGKKGKTGEHMLQVRAWRGLQDGGDWVVAWSPDIVNVVQ
jgi:hypothetical protein